MVKYSQPSFYRFSRDSIELANLVVEDEVSGHLLDVCCGSGVIGIEATIKGTFNSVTFVELQEDYLYHIKENCKNFLKNVPYDIEVCDVTKIKLERSFDCIVMNPPYFSRKSYRQSPNIQKDICRSYDPGAISKIFEASIKLLAKEGSFYIVIRDNEALDEIKSCIRENHVLEIRRKEDGLLFLRIRHLNVN
ncbi:methyltransferase [Bacteriovorax sp. DB6_IX]|uniref:methyltransferase n=1 Tax=Bacteriovorax sp. DB6_IX TaxID=1353530 RepID=UPI00038A5439|nr:methyltransferase [Bacteriovorax sp. DB6_IX]EQC51458.1 RNA cap guanine-N2 methyltransferase [Bacteriovorax sp. DB6_IX]